MSAHDRADAESFADWWKQWGDTVRFWKARSMASAAYRDGYAAALRARHAQEGGE